MLNDLYCLKNYNQKNLFNKKDKINNRSYIVCTNRVVYELNVTTKVYNYHNFRTMLILIKRTIFVITNAFRDGDN